MDKVQGIISSAIGRRAAEDAQSKKKAKLQKPKKHSYKKGAGNPKNIRTNPRAMKRAADRTAGLAAIDRNKRGVTIKNCGKGNDVAGLVGYATLDKKEHKLLDTNCDDWDSFIATTNELKKLRPDIKANVQHVAISFRSDTNFDLNRLDEMAAEIRKDLGIDDSFPFAVVQHFDTADKNPHAHLIWSRISVSGEVHDNNSLSFRCASSEQRMENLYQLDCVPMKRLDIKKASKKEIEMQLRTGELSTRAKFQTICIDAMRDCATIVTYFNRLQAAGFDIEITTQDGGERISGIVYHLNGDTMKASDLGKAFTFNGLTTKANITYVKNRDFESITKIQERTALKQFRAAGGDITDAELSIGGANGASPSTISVGNEPASGLSSTNSAHIGNRDGQRLSQDRSDEPNRQPIQRPTASQPIAIKSDMGNSNPSHQRASDLISDLADATAIATSDKREGASPANQPATSSNAAAQIAQIKAFGKIQLQLSIMLPPKEDGSRSMIKRDFDASNWDKFKGFATAQNAQGGDIYIAPHPNAEHSFILLDDLTVDSVNQMSAQLDGLEPAIIVESSPNNFQAWIKLSDKPLTKEQRLEASRLLTKKYEADGAAVGSVRIGRVAGFTNRKAKHKNAQGLQPYCKLTAEPREEPATNGHLIVEQANELIANTKASAVKNKRVTDIESARDYLGYGASPAQFFQTEAKKILKQYGDQADLSRLDFMVCRTMIQSNQFGSVQIAEAMREASPSIDDRKHNIEDYIERTIAAARAQVEFQRQLQQQHESEDTATDDHTL